MSRRPFNIEVDPQRIYLALLKETAKNHVRIQQVFCSDPNELDFTVKVTVMLFGGGRLDFRWDLVKNILLKEDDDMAKIVPSLIYESERDMWAIRSPYNKAWIDDFKFQVPGQGRMWDKDKKLWYYDPMFHDVVKRLCDIHFQGYKESKADMPPPPPPPPPPPAAVGTFASYFKFLTLCDKDMLKKLYRASAALHHPDRGGDAKKMQELNVAWAEISRDLKIS